MVVGLSVGKRVLWQLIEMIAKAVASESPPVRSHSLFLPKY